MMWGEVGTDQKVLFAIQLKEDENKVHIYGFPKEKVTKEIQDKLFSEWKNGGAFDFPEDIYHWQVSASEDNLLPEEVRVDRPEIVIAAQAAWGKKIMSARLNEVLVEEANLIEQKLESIQDYDQQLWDKTKELWAKISDYRKKGELSWEHTDVLKSKINAIFDGLKAVKRIDVEKTDEESVHNFKEFLRKIEEQTAKLIYPDEWDKVFDNLKVIQADIKDYALSWRHKRVLFDKLNDTFLDLRKYKKTEFINKTKDRIKNLNTTIGGIVSSVQRDKENYQTQFEKLMHYTRGKLSETEAAQRLGYILDRIKEKEDKIKNIKDTIDSLVKQVSKEEKAKEDLAVKPNKPERKEKKDEEKTAVVVEKKAEAQENTEEAVAMDTQVADNQQEEIALSQEQSKEEVVPAEDTTTNDEAEVITAPQEEIQPTEDKNEA